MQDSKPSPGSFAPAFEWGRDVLQQPKWLCMPLGPILSAGTAPAAGSVVRYETSPSLVKLRVKNSSTAARVSAFWDDPDILQMTDARTPPLHLRLPAGKLHADCVFISMAVEASNPRLYKLQPTKGPQDGGTSVTLSGTDFRYGTTMCQFGTSSAIQASYISQTSVVCISPAGPAAGAASVTVEVTSDNSGSADTYSTDGLLFAYQGENPYTSLAASVL